MAGKTLIRKEATQYERDVLGRPVWYGDRILRVVTRADRRVRQDPQAVALMVDHLYRLWAYRRRVACRLRWLAEWHAPRKGW